MQTAQTPSKSFTIDVNQADQRFDRWCRKVFSDHPEVKLGQIFKRVRKGIIKINDKKGKENQRLNEGDEVTMWARGDDHPLQYLLTKEEKVYNLDQGEMKQMILYEDEHRLVWDKPADVVMHGGNDHTTDVTMHDYLQAYTGGGSGAEDQTFTPSFGYRLDKDTSGVVIAAKDYQALQYLNQVIRERKVQKCYYAVVKGIAPDHNMIVEPLFRGYNKKFGRAQMFVNHQQGVESKTEFRREKTIKHEVLGDISLIKVKLYTGRMHQIRVHCAWAGYPIIGDIMYGDDKINRIAKDRCYIARQLLHAAEYEFDDIFTNKKLVAKSGVPAVMTDLFI